MSFFGFGLFEYRVLKMLFVPGMNLAIPAQICHVLVNLTAGRM